MQRPRLLTEQLQYFSLFSGIGGFELGIQNGSQAKGIQQRTPNSNLSHPQRPQLSSKSFCIGFSEIDKYAVQIYKTHFNHKEYGDVSAINWSNTENFDLLVGGFPCQAFSIAGKRQGFDDTRGTLFFEITRCLKEKQPRLLLLENVKGLLSHNKGQTFGVILNTLDELGYDLQWQVLNSKNFGVPQNRERVFIVGHLRGISRPQVFPIRETDKETIGKINCIYELLGVTPSGLSRQGDRVFGVDGISPTLTSFAETSIPKILKDTDYGIRRLTPTECERLQGFPDGWTEGISDTQRYKCLGNAVTVNVIETIMTNLLK